jgi:DNA-binding beta-propeller fold protein YncE
VSVTVHRGVVYVLNARGGGSIQGFARIGDRLVLVPAWHRELGFDPAASPEFTSTPGQVAFTPDGSRLLVTTKGDGQSIEVFGLGRSGPALEPVITPDPGNVPFGIAFDRHGRVLVVEAAPSAVATFGLQPDGTLALEGRVTTGQAAACWITVSHKLVYVSNAGSATVSGFTDHRGVLTSLGRTPTDPGTVDSAATPDGRYLYVQGGAKGTVDGFAIGRDGSLTALGAVSVPDGAGGEGIVAS